DPQGRAIPNIGTGPGYSIYEKAALATRAAAERAGMPYTWGGHFRSGVPFDLMHMQRGGPSRFGFDPKRVQQEVERQSQLAGTDQAQLLRGGRGLAGQLGTEDVGTDGAGAAAGGGAAGGMSPQAFNFMHGISFLETSWSAREAYKRQANTGFFQMSAQDAALARKYGLPDPRTGSYAQQMKTSWEFVKQRFPTAAAAVERGDYQ